MDATLMHPEKCNYLDEAELITRTQNGDTEAFTPIVLMYRERIYKLIYRIDFTKTWTPHQWVKERPYRTVELSDQVAKYESQF